MKGLGIRQGRGRVGYGMVGGKAGFGRARVW